MSMHLEQARYDGLIGHVDDVYLSGSLGFNSCYSITRDQYIDRLLIALRRPFLEIDRAFKRGQFG